MKKALLILLTFGLTQTYYVQKSAQAKAIRTMLDVQPDYYTHLFHFSKEGIWLLNNIKLNAGKIRFLYNNDWNINYGDNGNDHISDMLNEDIKIESGNYNIVPDLTDEAKPKYSILKKL